MKKSNNGITLIVLVITIIVMLILAGISLTFALGENGILEKAKNAAITSRESQAKEEVTMAWIKTKSDSSIDEESDTNSYVKNLLNKFLKDTGEVIGLEYNKNATSTLIYRSNDQDWEYTFKIKRRGKVELKLIKDRYGNIIKSYLINDEEIANGDSNKCTITLNANDTVKNLDFLSSSEKESIVAVINPRTISVNKGETIGSLPEPKVSMWFVKFSGWYTEPTGGDLVTDQTIVNTNTTFYAHYTEAACFVAGTRVLTESGMKNIEEIIPGESVYTLNLDINEREIKKVTKIHENQTNEIYEIITDEDIIKCTPRHEIFIVDKGWTRAYNINQGDYLLGKDNKIVKINEIKYKNLQNPINAYNLSIEGNHNYLITDSEILVHNARSPGYVDYNYLIAEMSSSDGIELADDFYIDIYGENSMSEEQQAVFEDFLNALEQVDSISSVFTDVMDLHENSVDIDENSEIFTCSDMISVYNYDTSYSSDINCTIKLTNFNFSYYYSDYICIIGTLDDEDVHWYMPDQEINTSNNTVEITLTPEFLELLEENPNNIFCMLGVNN